MATVFSIYVVITIVVTLFHIVMEINNAHSTLTRDLDSLGQTFSTGISTAMWNVDPDQTMAIMQGMLRSETIEGIKIESPILGNLTAGTIPKRTQAGKSAHTFLGKKLQIQSTITIQYNELKEETYEVGRMHLYSSNSVLFKRVKPGIIIILINSVIKSAALWVIFLYFSRRLLSRPLEQLTEATTKVNFDDQYHRIEIKTRDNNELKQLEQAFNAMIQKLYQSRDALSQSLDFLSKSNARLREIVNSSQEVVSSQYAFFTFQETCHAILRQVPMTDESHVTFFYEDDTAQGTGFVFFAVDALLDEENLLKLKLDRIAEVDHRFGVKLGDLGLKEEDFRETSLKDNTLTLPLQQGNEISGGIVITGVNQKQWQEEDWYFTSTLVQFLSIYLQNLRFTQQLERRVNERTKQLQDALMKLETQHAELKQTQASLIESEKMAGLGTLVAGVAHEMNNPTNFIYLGAQSLKREIGEQQDFLSDLLKEEPEILMHLKHQNSPINEALQTVLEGSERIAHIVQDLRTFSRLDQAERKAVSVVQSIQSTVRIINTKYKKHIEFNQHYHYDPELECWPAKLNQAFMNMIINAAHAIEKKQETAAENFMGLIEVESTETQRKGKTWLTLRIQDNGIGMDQETRKKVFEPFFTTKDVGQGTGMGMSITYGIIEEHGGEIEIDSELGKGTTISIHLPVNSVK